MSRRTSDNNNSSIPAWLKVMGAGAALAGAAAAVSYGASRLVQGMQTVSLERESTTCEQSGASSSNCCSSVEDRSPTAGTSKSAASPTQQSYVLRKELLDDYYMNYVSIPKAKMQEATSILAEAEKILKVYFRDVKNSIIKFDRIDRVGSAVEGLKVVAPDEFDLALVFTIADRVGVDVLQSGSPGFCVVTAKNIDSTNPKDSILVKTDKFGLCVSPRKVQSFFQSHIQKAFNRYFPHYETHVNGPSLKTIYHDPLRDRGAANALPEIDIDMAPTLVLNNKMLVNKPHHLWNKNGDSEFRDLWQLTNSSEERQLIDSFPTESCHRMCLQVFKAVRLNYFSQLGVFSSYHLKTVLFHMMKSSTADEWNKEYITERFIDMVNKLAECLEQRDLPNYFIPDLNLLEFYTDTQLAHVANFLRNKLKSGNLGTLLKEQRVLVKADI